jgi:hypothetical protein
MPNLIELTCHKPNPSGPAVSRTMVNINSIAIINELAETEPSRPSTEVRISGGGTVQCMESYDAIKFLIGMKNE